MELGRVAEHVPREIADEEYDAAVLAAVVEREADPYLLFTKRADHLGEHAGQMSFPGGGREPSDTDLRATALREAEEEIGLRPDETDIVGRLDDIRTTSKYSVTPYVARIPDREYAPDEREVAEIAVLPVRDCLTRTTTRSSAASIPGMAKPSFTSSTSMATRCGARRPGFWCSCWS